MIKEIILLKNWVRYFVDKISYLLDVTASKFYFCDSCNLFM